jgi:hypothetical protein
VDASQRGLEPLANESLVVGDELTVPVVQPRPHPGERKRIALQALQHGEQVARLALTGVRRRQGLVLEHAGQHEHATSAAVSPIARDVIGIAVH